MNDGTISVLLNAPAHYPQWSPDGEFILYRRSDKTGIEAITPSGGPFPINLPPLGFRNSVDNPYRFLPPGSSQIVMLRGQYRNENFWLADLHTGKLRQVTDLQAGPSILSFDVASDGRILFDRARQNADIVMIEPSR